jgi:indole-3-glycerol phosphate synthase
MSILEKIFEWKKDEVAQQMAQIPLPAMQVQAGRAPGALDFVGALRRRAAPALLAEIKRASPSRGALAPHLDAASLAEIYTTNGAAAVSVLTDERFFGGSLEDLRAVRRRFPRLPLLRKDFIFHPYQLYQARAAGADAVLLIAAYLPPEKLQTLHRLARLLGMDALVEVHSQKELEAALKCSPRLVGINNRNLHDFQVSLETTLALRLHVPPQVCLVAESGIHTLQDVELLRPAGSAAQAGVDAILVGEALVTAADIAGKVRELASLPQVAEVGNAREVISR